MKQNYGPFALRIGVGGLFLLTGIMKLMDPSKITGMLDGFGFPASTFWAWLLIFVELLCGASVLVGFKVKYATVPLAIVLLVAIVLMAPNNMMSALKDAVILSGLVSLWLSGPGTWAVDKK